MVRIHLPPAASPLRTRLSRTNPVSGFAVDGIQDTTAQQPVTMEVPYIPDLANRRPGVWFGQSIGWVIVRFRQVLERGDPQIDLAHLEAGGLEIEIEAEHGEVTNNLEAPGLPSKGRAPRRDASRLRPEPANSEPDGGLIATRLPPLYSGT